MPSNLHSPGSLVPAPAAGAPAAGRPQHDWLSIERLIVQSLPVPAGPPSYDQGFRDALESVVLAIKDDPTSTLFDVVKTALDAFANNAPECDQDEPAPLASGG